MFTDYTDFSPKCRLINPANSEIGIISKHLEKPDNDPLYINALSDLPKNIIKQVPNMSGKRISEIFYD